MKNIVNWGIIAAGGIARRRTIPGMQGIENARLLAVMDMNLEIARAVAEEYHVPFTYGTEDELLNNQEIDAVYVASPVCFHKEQAIKVLEAGKGLLLEKPLAMNEEDAKEIVEFAKKQGKCAGVAMVMKHHPAHQVMKQIIESGEIGEIVSCRAQLNCWFPDMEGNWRQTKRMAGGGALVDMGTHCIDILRYLLEDDAQWVFGDIETKTFQYEVDDSADCMLRMKKGASCYIDLHFNIPDEAAKGMLEIYGTKGSILAQGTIGQDGHGNVYLNQCDTEKGYVSNQVREEGGIGHEVDYKKINIYGAQIADFSSAVLNSQRPKTSLEDAMETVRTIDALYQSADAKKTIEL